MEIWKEPGALLWWPRKVRQNLTATVVLDPLPSLFLIKMLPYKDRVIIVDNVHKMRFIPVIEGNICNCSRCTYRYSDFCESSIDMTNLSILERSTQTSTIEEPVDTSCLLNTL